MASVVLYIEKRYCSRCGARVHKRDMSACAYDGRVLCEKCEAYLTPLAMI